MIVYFLLQIPILVIGTLLMIFPVVTELPFGIDDTLTTGMGYLYFIITIFPPIGAMYSAFLWVLSFKLGLKFLSVLPFYGRLIGK